MIRAAVISVDGHVRASRQIYRDYVEARYLEDYDNWARSVEGMPDSGNRQPTLDPDVQWDSQRRLADLESNGVVAEVLFPNGLPFQAVRFEDHGRAITPELTREAQLAHNRWLVDFCADVPGRRSGQALVSFRDVDQAVEDVIWAKEHGLGGIMMPALTPGDTFFFDPALDPIWAAIEEVGLPISQHGGCGDPRLQPGRLRGDHDARHRTLLLLRAFVVADDPGRGVRALPGPQDGLRRDRGRLDRADHAEARPPPQRGRRLVGLLPVPPAGALVHQDRARVLGDQLLRRHLAVHVHTRCGRGAGGPPGVAADGTDFHISAERAMFGVDYPHFESIFPTTRAQVTELVSHPDLSEEAARGILFENAASVYGFDLARSPGRHRAGRLRPGRARFRWHPPPDRHRTEDHRRR